MIHSELPLVAALGLGILTSISPCPMASHAAAVSVLVRQAGSWRRGLLDGAAYAAGRAAAYTAIAMLVSMGSYHVGPLVRALQFHSEMVLGWVFLAGGVLLGVSPWLRIPGRGIDAQRWKESFDRFGHATGAFLLGAVLALAFCPVSAGIFFGSVIPLAVATTPSWTVTASYGLATALPVMALVVAAIFGTRRVARTFRATQSVVPWLHGASVVGMLLAGAWFLARSW